MPQVDYAALAKESGAISSVPPPAAPSESGGFPARGWQPAGAHDTHEGEPANLEQMLGPLAHPQTLTDFARLLTLPVDSVRKALIGAMSGAAAKGAASAAPKAIVRGAVNGAAALGDAVDPDVIGVVSPRAGKVVQIAQKLRDARPAPVAAPVAEAAPVVAPAAEAAPVAAPVGNALPDQKALNEAALAARRAAYQAKQATASAPSVVAPAAKFRLSADESKVFARLIRDGKTDAQARAAIEAGRAFQERFGTPTPTAAETRFPKGMRGKSEGD